MTTYNKKELNHYKGKDGGKNQSAVDGFYSNNDGEHFFIKKPENKVELFTELFAGLLLQEFKNRKLIDEIYFPSLICADVIRFDDGSYGLIQPVVSFDELHKVIGTSYKDGSDRDPMKEALYGPSYYTGVTKLGDTFGLSISLMFSLLLGAHSVHSGNMVVLKGDEAKGKQLARLDWGDAFRYFAHPNNNSDILYAHENRGWFNYKSITKDYFLNFKKINGLYPAMAEKAEKLLPQLNEELLADIVSSALKKIPADLINKKTQAEIARYMVMPSLSGVTFGKDGQSETFAKEMSKLLLSRLNSISRLHDLQAQKNAENIYASVIITVPQTLSFADQTSFSEILKSWNNYIVPRAELQTEALDLTRLADYFNQYVTELAEKTESAQLWLQDPSTNKDLFMPYHTEDGQQVSEHTFVPQYKESTVIKRLFTMNTQTFGAFRFAGFEQPLNDYSKANPESAWVKIQTLLQAGQQVIKALDALNKANAFGMDEAAAAQTEQVKNQLKNFEKAEAEVNALLNTAPALIPEQQNTNSSFFYPITELELNKMTGHQLATICLEELNNPGESALVNRIINNDRLWYRMDDAFETGVYNSRQDEADEKIAKIRGSRKQIEAVRERSNQQIVALEEQIASLDNQITAKTEDIERLNSTLAEENKKREQAEQSVAELKRELERPEPADEPIISSAEESTTETENKLVQELLKEEISSLLKENGNNKAEIEQLKQMIEASKEAQNNFEAAQKERKDTYFARMERMLPIIVQIQGIESKADKLNDEREEFEAAQEAYKLANRLRSDLKEYAEDPEKNEDIALSNFKINAIKTIDKSKEILGKHREEWKYILANVTLGILLVGIGYAAAALINKQITGNYTFFSKTESIQQVEKLQKEISFQEIPSASTLKGG